MTPTPDPDRPPTRVQPGDGWVTCSCGSKHWGLHGAAGLLLRRNNPATGRAEVVLQHRALWSHHGGTWGVPGGAIGPDETAAQGALREAHEEAGIDPGTISILGEHVLDHGLWRYTTILGEFIAGRTSDVRPTDPESLQVLWVGVDDVTDLPLLPAFATAWPTLRAAIAGPASV